MESAIPFILLIIAIIINKFNFLNLLVTAAGCTPAGAIVNYIFFGYFDLSVIAIFDEPTIPKYIVVKIIEIALFNLRQNTPFLYEVGRE